MWSLIKICLICIIGIYRLKEKFHRRTLKQQWTIKFFSIFSLAAILVGSWDHRTQFWKGAIQGSFHQSLVAFGTVVSEEKIFMWISHRVLCWVKFGCGGHLGRRSEMPDTFLEGDHPRIISAKFGWDWLSSFRGEDFFLNFIPPFF
jgi:hypothetical protein